MQFMRQRFRHLNLRTQMIAAFLIVALLVLTILAFFYIRTIRTALIEQGNQALFAAASRTAISVDDFIHANLGAIRSEATLPAIVTYMSMPLEARAGSEEEMEALTTLDRLRAKDFFYILSYSLLDENGRNLLDTAPSNMGTDEADFEYFQIPYQTGLPFVSPIQFSDSVGGVYFYFSSPVRNEVGQIVGVLRVQYSVAALQELVSQSAGIVGDDSFAILIDENTMQLANDARPETIFKTITPLEDDAALSLRARGRLPNLPLAELNTHLTGFANSLRNAGSDPFFATEIYDQAESNQAYQMAVVSLQNQPWWVVYTQTQSSFLVPIQRAVQFTLVWTLFVALLFILSSIIIVRWLTDPIAHLTAVAENITHGDLSAQAEIRSGDEIGLLAQAFNNMTSQLRQTLEGLEKRETALEESNKQLENALAELKEAQSQIIQQERMAAVGQLAAGIAHDFNNILISIILSADMLLTSGNLNEKDRAKIAVIQDQGNRAADLTQQILDFSRRSVLQLQDIDLGHYLEDMKKLLSRTLPENIRLTLHNTQYRFFVRADPNRLQQVILNLAINARNAMPDGGELNISIGRLEIWEDGARPLPAISTGNWVYISVCDSGIGIPQNEIARIFEPFFTTRAPLGSGLGLSQVDGIVKQLGGHISVETTVGSGTTFTIYLPEMPDTSFQQASQTQLVIMGQGETILLVEDDELVRQSLQLTLETLDYQVISVANGQDALLTYRQKWDEIDLIMTDLVMPEMGGERLLQLLKEENSAARAIIITGYTLANDPNELKALNAVAWCQKPVTTEKLSQTVARALHKKAIS